MRNVRSTGPLWAVKTGYIVVSALFCVLGVVLFITAERCVPWIGRALGIGMVICGAIKLGGYFSKDLFRLAFRTIWRSASCSSPWGSSRCVIPARL